MRIRLTTLSAIMAALLFMIPGASRLHAQIVDQVRAHIEHSFVIGNTALPPGDYTFSMMSDSQLTIMTASNEKDKISVGFIVQNITDDHMPKHSEVVFRKYGDTEFLNKIFEGGSKVGVQLTETGRQEARLVNEGLQPTEHTEEQQ